MFRPDSHREEVAEMRGELRALRQDVALSMLQQTSASARLQGVSVSAQVARQDPQVMSALLETLATDPSPNVRLAAVHALNRVAPEEALAVPPLADEPAAPLAAPPAIELEIVAGTGEQAVCVFELARIEIGRCAEVRDRRNRLVRTNHLVFADTDHPLNQTVSRRHAHVDFRPAEAAFRVYDDGSEQGTSVARTGRTIAVPPGPRGVRLQPGDEIVLGLARVRVKWPATRAAAS